MNKKRKNERQREADAECNTVADGKENFSCRASNFCPNVIVNYMLHEKEIMSR